MIFQPELARLVMAGEKTVTRRVAVDNPRSPWWRERCGLVVGRDYAVCPGRGKPQVGRVRIVDTWLSPLGQIMRFGAREAQREGFATAFEFATVWEHINGVYDPATLVWRIEMEVDG